MDNVYQAPESDISTSDDDSTQPVKLFNASGRMGRIRYVAFTVGMPMAIYLVAALAIGIFAGVSGSNSTNISSFMGGAALVVFGIFYIFIIAVAIWATIQRCHDFDVSGWLALLLIVPLVPLIFWFIPGTQGENKFGLKPDPNKTIHWIGAIVAPILMVVGILAAIAIPAYQDYVERAKAAQIRSGG